MRITGTELVFIFIPCHHNLIIPQLTRSHPAADRMRLENNNTLDWDLFHPCNRPDNPNCVRERKRTFDLTTVRDVPAYVKDQHLWVKVKRKHLYRRTETIASASLGHGIPHERYRYGEQYPTLNLPIEIFKRFMRTSFRL